MDSFASPDGNPIPPSYQLTRSGDADDEFSSVVESETYMPLHQAALQQQQHHHRHHDDDTTTPHHHHNDATAAVHEMHLALLYLLSHPDEFRAAVERGPYSSSTPNLAQWNADYCDTESLATETTTHDPAPLPYVIFADDAEVVLPQAHTASQLFGVETMTGMELEAAAGIPNISTLFLRWLALMPGADHLDIIDPPGLTVMRIAGNRYRVTAAHRCYWTWMNELADVSFLGHAPPPGDGGASASKNHELMEGDYVCLTIVDVFETDNQGKLLSYCPTFDNRQVHKTDRNLHMLRKQATRLQTALVHSKLAKLVSQHATAVLQQIQGKNGGNESSGGSPSRQDTVSFCSSSLGHTKFSGYMGDGEGERHEV